MPRPPYSPGVPLPHDLYSEALAARLDDPDASFRSWRGDDLETTDRRVEHGRGLLRELYEEGWNRHGWPTEAGGIGGDARHRAILYDELQRAGINYPEQNVILETIGPPVLEFAPALAKRFLPAVLRGDEIWSQGFSEPDAGSDLASLRCRARPQPDGGFVIDGQKIWTTLGHMSDRIALLCRTGASDSRHRGLTMLLVDMNSPGVEARPIRLAGGLDDVSEVFFDGVHVTCDRVIGHVDGGWAVAMYLLQFERGTYAWMRQAALTSYLARLCASPGLERRAPAGARRELGRAELMVAALKARSSQTVARLARGEEVGSEASADKILLAEAEQSVLDVARDLLSDEFTLGSGEAWRSAWFYTRAASIYGGSGEVQRGIIADRVLGLPREVS